MEQLQPIIETVFNTPHYIAQPVSGGDINQAYRVMVGGERFFIKRNTTAPPGFFGAEAFGLEQLRASGVARVPQVIAAYDGDPEHSTPAAYLVLEWIDADEHGRFTASFAERLGEMLAALHRVSAPVYGLERDTYIGRLPQRNPSTADWVTFYRDSRLSPQIALAQRSGLLSAERERRLWALLDRLPALLHPVPRVPSLLHGDLWAGNFLAAAGQPVLIDPAVYYGDREIELAFTELFGGFPPGFLPAYHAAYPLTPGYAERRPLYQLYPLLVHLNLFGLAYARQVDAICRLYAG